MGKDLWFSQQILTKWLTGARYLHTKILPVFVFRLGGTMSREDTDAGAPPQEGTCGKNRPELQRQWREGLGVLSDIPWWAGGDQVT